jgi:hypothetical protein
MRSIDQIQQLAVQFRASHTNMVRGACEHSSPSATRSWAP